MKKLLSIALVLVMVLAFAVPAMADGELYKDADRWYYHADAAGTLTVKDNKDTYEYEVVVGCKFLGLQRDYTGQLELVSFEPAFLLWQHDDRCTIHR